MGIFENAEISYLLFWLIDYTDWTAPLRRPARVDRPELAAFELAATACRTKGLLRYLYGHCYERTSSRRANSLFIACAGSSAVEMVPLL